MADRDSKLGYGVRFCCLLLASAWTIFSLSFGGPQGLTGVVVIGLAISPLFFKKELS